MMKYKKVLLVDDDIDDRMIFEQILQEIDPAIIMESAENGLEMIDYLDRSAPEQLPELIILDQNMPRMTGKESLLFLKQSSRYQDIPIIIYSTYQVRDFFHECLEMGALYAVSKPDTIQSYRDMINQFFL